MPIYPRDYISSFVGSGSRSTCFVLMPFAPHFNDVYNSIRNACEAHEVLLACSRADDFYGGGHIMEDILGGILGSAFIVADVTGKNPNVFYELGIAHCCKTPDKVIIISESMDDVPFDLRHMRCLTYRNDPAGLRHLEQNLIRAFASDGRELYRFVAEEQRSFEFQERLTGRNRNFYRFTMSDLHVGNGAAKFGITVHQESLDEGNRSYDTQWHYVTLEEDRPAQIEHTDWELWLDRTEGRRAYFSLVHESEVPNKRMHRSRRSGRS